MRSHSMSKLVLVCCVTTLWSLTSAIPVNLEEGNYFEGDIVGPLPTIDPQSGLIEVRYRWPNNTLTYEIAREFPEDFTKRFVNALTHIVSRTCIRFRKKTSNDTDYVHVFEGIGCYSYVGRVGGRQDLSLSYGCSTSLGTNVHEIMHALGFFHEQSRRDRDEYIIINWQNIGEANKHNFDKQEGTSPFNVPYDYDSVMHYDKFAFSTNGRETITVKSGAPIGQRVSMSDKDWTKINNMYCPNTLAIRIRNAGDLLYLQLATNYTSDGGAVIASSFQRADHQLWTVDGYNIKNQIGSTLVPWSQDGGSLKYLDENSSSNVVVRSFTSLISRHIWTIKRVDASSSADNPWQIVNQGSGLCLYSRGSLQARTTACNVNDASQIWNIFAG